MPVAIQDTRSGAQASHANGIFANTLILVLYTGFETVIVFVFTVLLARFLGTDSFGRLGFTLSYALLTSVVADPGVSIAVMKLVARSRGIEQRVFVGNGIRIRLLFSAAVMGLSFIPFTFNEYMRNGALLIICIVVSEHVRTFTLYFCYMFRAHQQTQFEALALSIERVGCLALGWILLRQGYGVNAIGAMYLLVRVVSLITAVMIYLRKHGAPILSRSRELSKRITSETVPLAIVICCDRANIYLPVVLVTALAGEYYTGLFQASYKLVMPALMLCAAVAGTLYAPMSASYIVSRENTAMMFRSAVRSVLHLLLPAAATTLVLAKPISAIVYGAAYAESAKSLQWLTPYYVSTGLISVSVLFLTAVDRQKVASGLSILSVLFMVTVGVFLIPRFAANGAAISMTVAQTISITIYLILAARLANASLTLSDWWSLLLSFAGALTACVLISKIVSGTVLVIAGIIASYAAYVLVYLLLDGFSDQEKQVLRRCFAALANAESS